MQNETKSVIIYGVAGALAAVASGVARVPTNGLLIALVILAVTTVALKAWLKPPGYKWFMSNGVYAYVIIWYVLFTLLYNMGGIA